MADRRELTARGLALGMALTALFTAANVFLGLRVGLTFATSIPAAVISMAVLRALPGSNVRENNIVQTVASAAGAIGSIIFILPGLVMIGWWADFPFWQSFGLCAAGGALGVVASVPLRRALVTGSDLPFPEGTAGAAVLAAGSDDAAGGAGATRAGLAAIVTGSAISAGYAALAATKLTADEAAWWVRLRGGGVTGLDAGLSFALLGVGHLVGLSVGIALLAGLAIGFWAALPLLAALHGAGGTPAEAAQAVWSGQVRFIGAGAIAVAALWSLGRLVAPIARGLRDAAAASRARARGAALAVEERDLPVVAVGLLALVLLVPVAALLHHFVAAGPLARHAVALTIGGTAFVIVMGAATSAVCGYMAGLIGSSNSPLSGVGILAVVAAAGLLAVTIGGGDAVVAFALFAVSIVFAMAVIANDNLQDLKTGQLVGATPWKQQVALIVGAVAGAATIPPVLNLLDAAYGFGAPTLAHPDPLPAPQAVLLSDIARGMLGGGLDWGLIGAGGALALALIAVDGWLGRTGRLRLPPLAVGIGIYLPMSATLPVVASAAIGHLWERRHPHGAHVGTLLASGLIVGESLFGVVVAALIVVTGSAAPLAIVSGGPRAAITGAIVFAGLAILAYARATRITRQVARKG